jgi:hypothetical protein
MHDDVSSTWFFDWTEREDRILGVNRVAYEDSIYCDRTAYIFGLWFFALYIIVKTKGLV